MNDLGYFARYGNAEAVKAWIPVSNPKAYDSEALQWAAEEGHTECVKLLEEDMDA